MKLKLTMVFFIAVLVSSCSTTKECKMESSACERKEEKPKKYDKVMDAIERGQHPSHGEI